MAANGPLTLTLEDGTVLADQTDGGLARQWAQHVNGSRWVEMSLVQQCMAAASALADLREAGGLPEVVEVPC